MLSGTQRAAILWAVLLFVLVVLLRLGASVSWGFGPQDLDRYAETAHGFELSRDTPPFFLTWSRGDGQAFMSIAADLNGDGVSRGLGLQTYRMSRIAHSVLARLFALGRIEWLPYGLAASSFAAYAGLLAVSVRLTDTLGIRSLALGLSPAAIFGTMFDTAEGLGTLLATVALTTSTLWLGVLSGAVLGIARPSYGTAVLASRVGPVVPASTVLAGAALQLLLVFGFGLPFAGSGGNIVIPFTGYIAALPSMHIVTIPSALVVLAMAVILFTYSVESRFTGSFRVAAAVSALLAISVGPSTFVGPMSPLRVSGALVVLLVTAPMFDRRSDAQTSLGGLTNLRRRERPFSEQ
jgi:hypothetical protein